MADPKIPQMTADTPLANAILRQALGAVQEVMGQQGLAVVLRDAHLERYIETLPPNDFELGVKAREYALLNEAIERMYGRGAKGTLRRIGRVSFQWGAREQAALLGVAGVAFKLMPKRMAIKAMLGNLAKALIDTHKGHAYMTVTEQDGKTLFNDYTCSICHMRHAEQPICYVYLGTIQEAVKFATGKEYEVTETFCRAKGDPYCQIVVGDEVG